jgi:hypothetical protein
VTRDGFCDGERRDSLAYLIRERREMAALAVMRTGLTAAQLRSEVSRAKDANAVRRMLALALVIEAIRGARRNGRRR